MLNILKVKINNKIINNSGKYPPLYDDLNVINKYLPSTKLWVDSAYNYNSINNKLLSYNNNIFIDLFKTFINSFTIPTNRRKIKKLIKINRKSCKRIFFSTPEVKHTNDKTNITVYTYNKKQHFLYMKLTYYLNIFFNSEDYILNFRWLKWTTIFIVRKILYISKMLLLEHNKVIIDSNLTFSLKELYGKNIEIDIINHKSMHFNSDVLSKIIAFKLKNRKAYLDRMLIKVLSINKLSVYSLLRNNRHIKEDLKENVLHNLKYKIIRGIKFETSGRLTRRLTAMRSVSKKNSVGSQKNLESSYLRLPTLLIRNNKSSSLQYTNINGKTRNGAFGLKCWVNNV